MGSELKAEFEFEIGDIVYLKTADHNDHIRPAKLMVTDRIIMECHGGIQTFYKVDKTQDMIPSIVLTGEMPPADPDCYRAPEAFTKAMERFKEKD